MKVVVDDKIETIRVALNKKGVNIIEASIIEKDKPEREANGLLVLTPEQFRYWTRESEAYIKKLQEEGRTVNLQDDTMTTESYIAPITFPTKEEAKKISSFTPEVEEYHKRLNTLTPEEKKEQKEKIEEYLKKKKNKNKEKKSKQDGFNSKEEEEIKEEVFYGWNNKDELADVGTPFILPTSPSLDDLEKKEKKKDVADLDPSDPFTSYVNQRKKEQQSRERTLEKIEIPQAETEKEIKEKALETFANLYGFSFESDNFLEHKKQLPLILLPERLKTLFLDEAKEQDLTPSQLFGQVFLRYMFKKITGEEV